MTASMGNLLAFAEDTELTYGVLTYEIGEGTINITDCDQAATEVEIPAEIDGLPVVSVDDGAFYNCEELLTMTVDPANTYLEAVDNVLYTEDKSVLIWYGCGKTAESFTVPSSVQTIAGYAFYDNKSLKNVTLPEGLTEIGGDAFSFCYGLTAIDLPSTLTYIGGWAFCYAGLTSLEIPEGVTYIGAGAFQGAEFTELTIPSSMKYLEGFLFAHCENLTTLTLPSTITSIGYGAFSDVTNLTDIYFDGTVADWEAMVADKNLEEENSEILYTTVVHCTDGTYTSPAPVVTIGLGDPNGDGSVNAADASILLIGAAEAAAGLTPSLTDEQMMACDVTNDGNFNAVDASWILQYAAYRATGGTLELPEFIAG